MAAPPKMQPPLGIHPSLSLVALAAPPKMQPLSRTGIHHPSISLLALTAPGPPEMPSSFSLHWHPLNTELGRGWVTCRCKRGPAGPPLRTPARSTCTGIPMPCDLGCFFVKMLDVNMAPTLPATVGRPPTASRCKGPGLDIALGAGAASAVWC